MVSLGVASLLAMVAVFVLAIVVSYDLLHGDQATDEPSRLAAVGIVGSEETVFSWARDRCEDEDIPDLAARAFRDDRGRVQLISAHFKNRRFIGRGFDALRHPCEVTMSSGYDPDPARFDDREWLAAPYTLDGETVYALVHDEYQGQQHPGQCPSGEYFSCWYNAITLAVSRDGGSTFEDARPAPGHLVASLPYRYVPDDGVYGLFSPSNIVRSRADGRYYALVAARRYKRQAFGSCLLRTERLDDPGSWRAWDGSGFDLALTSPYGPDPPDRGCTPVSPNDIGGMHESLTYNTYLGKYVLVGLSSDTLPGRRGLTSGIYYSVSGDLKDWSRRRLIREVEIPGTYECGDRNPVLYPSLIDHESSSRNFETTGRSPYMYFTRFHYRDCVQTLNRDLIRVRIEFAR
jgi:hypothetical protein